MRLGSVGEVEKQGGAVGLGETGKGIGGAANFCENIIHKHFLSYELRIRRVLIALQHSLQYILASAVGYIHVDASVCNA